DLIYRSLSEASRADLDSFDVLDVVPSTNTWLMQQDTHERGRFRVVLAEHQTNGRGRQNKRWVSPPRAGLSLSVAYTFNRNPGNLSCVTLAAGVGIANALQSFGLNTVKLKWPNDLYVGSAKLGGILTDAQTAPGSRITMICGVGINIDIGTVSNADEYANIDYTITDLQSHVMKEMNRSQVAGKVIDQLLRTLARFEEEGLAPFRADWNKYDWLKSKQVDVTMPDCQLSGLADGIDANGALRVMTEHGLRRVYTGSIAVRGGSEQGA
ncbi:MAG: biotin--[acetyl-CoA-carboxylase] ligase, partial [Woeseia sp.]